MDDHCQESLVSTQGHTFTGVLDDSVAAHRLIVHLEHKSPRHTVCDSLGEIVQDRCITLESLQIDCLDLTPAFRATAQYYHNHNGQQPDQVSPLLEFMGWNGRVIFDFTSPIYIWLLKHELD